MVLYGYTIGDKDDPGTPQVGFDVYRVRLDSGTFNLVGTIPTGTGAGQVNPAYEDLEGLGTNPNTNRITAVSESDYGSGSSSSTLGNDPGVFVTNVDAPGTPVVNNFDSVFDAVNTVGSNNRRFGEDSGADYSGNTLFIIQGNDSASNGAIGSSLYRVDPGTDDATLVARNATAGQISGSAPVNTEYADGLAIRRQFLGNGSQIVVASDFAQGDGDGNEIYFVNTTTGRLSTPVQLVTPGGVNLNLDTEGGLGFTPDGETLYGWTQEGALYTITDYLDEFLALPTRNNTATATFVRNYALPEIGTAIDSEYEGFTIVDEPATPSTYPSGSSIAAASFDFGGEEAAFPDLFAEDSSGSGTPIEDAPSDPLFVATIIDPSSAA